MAGTDGVKRASVKIHGIVQGVGFRPFIHKLVREYALAGYIKNTSSGVELELEGEENELRLFVADIPEKAPILAVIESVELDISDELKHFTGFEIRKSKTENERNTLISPDICICGDCLKELFTPGDRRYKYPFINCTNCGPRFTIIRDVPYDRPKTSMCAFPMCPDCAREYGDIEDRRYHAQPDCCPDCGPQVFFLDFQGKELCGNGIELAKKYISDGKIIAVKGLGGMHLACRVDDEALVRTLRRRKQRDEKPFAIMCRDVDTAKRICSVSEDEEKALTSFRRPIVLLRKLAPSLEYISENGFVGVMLPYTPLHYLLMGEDIDMLVMTSANLSDTPIMYKNDEAVEKLRGIADGFLLHNRDIQTRCDDSLCWVLDGSEYLARRSRGYVPFPVKIQHDAGRILACGAEQKASFSLSKGNYVFSSQHIGDLKNMETLDNYTDQIRHFQRLFDIKPQIIACDMHPDYMSTAYAAERSEADGIPLLHIQHHHAHLASCMADNGLDGHVLGLIWDGTGYGTDGTVWGGELLCGGYDGFERVGSIRPIPLIGGDRAVKETDRVAYALLSLSGEAADGFENGESYASMLKNDLNCPLSSGMGRLFDGVSAILGIKRKCSYEGQGAVLLEAAATCCDRVYPYGMRENIFDWAEMIKAICADMRRGVAVGEIAAAFMNTLADMAVKMCIAARDCTGLSRVCLSGGTFQNMYLMNSLPGALRDAGFTVYHHRRVSANDEGISLGQIMIAAEKYHVSCSST